MPQVRVAGDRAAAAVLGIAGMTAGDDDLGLSPGFRLARPAAAGQVDSRRTTNDRQNPRSCGSPGSGTRVVKAISLRRSSPTRIARTARSRRPRGRARADFGATINKSRS